MSKIKKIETDKYKILFNMKTGFEIISGINGYDDPIVLDHPILLDIGIKGTCSNNSCKFCYQGSEQRPDMPLDVYKSIVNEVKDHTCQISFGGKGDPNEHLFFKEFVEYTVKNNVVVNYTTSGYNLTDEQVEISKQCGAVAVSIGNTQPYTFQAIKKLQDNNIKTNLHWVLSKKSINDVIKVLQGEDVWNGLIDRTRINSIILLSFKPKGKGESLIDWVLDDEDIKSLLTNLRNNKNNFKIGADSCIFCKISFINKLTELEKLLSDTCEAGRSSTYISCDGYMIPCSYGDREKYGISINNHLIKEIWSDSEVFKKFRNELQQNPHKCPYGF